MPIPHFDGSLEAWLVMAMLVGAGGLFVWFGQMLEAPALTGLGALSVLATLLWAGPALAVQADGDIEALAAKAKARGEHSAKALAPWVLSLKPPGDADRAVAAAVAEGQAAALRRGAQHLDDPAQRAAMAGVGQPDTALGSGAVYVAISLSMPPETLRALGHDASKAGVRLVLRGLSDGSFKGMAIRVRQVFDQHAAGGVGIDPKVFRAFGVTAAPTFIAAATPVEPCGSFDCTPAAPAHDKVAGNISLEAALEVLADARGPGAPAAAAALKRLRS